MARLLLTNEDWALIADVFPSPAATGRPRCDPRRVLDGILWVLRTGRRGATYQRNSARGRRHGECSTSGTAMARSTQFSAVCKVRLPPPGRSTSDCGASTARRCGRRVVQPAVEKK